jgi:hypothetical protein
LSAGLDGVCLATLAGPPLLTGGVDGVGVGDLGASLDRRRVVTTIGKINDCEERVLAIHVFLPGLPGLFALLLVCNLTFLVLIFKQCFTVGNLRKSYLQLAAF